MKVNVKYEDLLSDIHVSVKKSSFQNKPALSFNAPVLSTPEGYIPGVSSFNLFERFKHLRIKPWVLVFSVLIICILSSALIMRHTIIAQVSSLYTNTYDKIALKIKPLPPLTAGDIRISSDRLSEVKSSINNQNLTLALGSTQIHPSPSLIKSWYKVSPSYYGKTTLYVNKNAIDSYLLAQVNKLKVAPINQVTVSLNDGYTTTLSAGSDGLTFPSSSSLSSQLSNNLLSGKGMNLSLAAITIPHTTTSQNAIAELLEVDVAAKRMYAYQNGSLVKTFLVTAGAPATPTPLGNFTIWDKTTEQTMTGFNPNGTKYVQPNVQWINYFDHSGDAVHGNYWRPVSYFGSVNSSHGCVGLMNTDAEWVYNWAPIGTPVVTHS